LELTIIPFGVAVDSLPVPVHPLQGGLQQVLAVSVAAREQDRRVQQPLAPRDQEFLKHRDRLRCRVAWAWVRLHWVPPVVSSSKYE
jgi:hypothetical protein